MFEIRAQANDTIEIMLYGTISQWEKVNATDFVLACKDALAKKPRTIVFPIHSPGGNVFEGVAMANEVKRLRTRGIKTIARVDGMAASMASVFASCCDETEVSPFSRIMVHEARMPVYGTVKQLRDSANLLESTNKDIIEIYAEKTGKDEKWITDNWMNGQDVWLNPQEAIDAKLADRKIGAVVKNLPKIAAIKDWDAIAANYDPYFKDDTTQNAMDKETKDKLIAALKLKADATDAEILAAAEAVQAAPATKEEKKDDKSAVDDGKKALVDGVVALAKERGMTDEKKLEALRKVAEHDVNAAMTLLPSEKKEDKPDKPAVSLNELIETFKKGGAGNGGSAERANWKYADWEKNDPNGLLALAKDKPAEFSKLFATNFGYTPSEEEIKNLVK